MNMKFYFCETCGVRLTEKDIEAGAAMNKKLKGVFCQNCAVGVSTMDSLPLRDDEARKVLEEEDAQQKARATPASTSSRAKALHSSRRLRAPQPKESGGNRSLVLAVGIGVVTFVGALTLMLGGDDGAEGDIGKKNPTQVVKKEALTSTGDTKETAVHPAREVGKREQEPEPIAPRNKTEDPSAKEPANLHGSRPEKPIADIRDGDTSANKVAVKSSDQTTDAPTEKPTSDERTESSSPAPNKATTEPVPEKSKEETSGPEKRRLASLLAETEFRARRQSAYSELKEAQTTKAQRILEGLQTSHRENEDLQAKLAKDLQVVGIVDEIHAALPRGVGVLKDGRAFTFHLTGGRTMKVGKNSSNTVKGIDGERIMIDMKMGGGTAEVPIDLSRLTLRTRTVLGRMGLGKKASDSLHEVLAQWLLAYANKKDADLKYVRARLTSGKIRPDQKPLAKHFLEVIDGMSREVMAKRALELIKEAHAAKSWEKTGELLKAYPKAHGSSAYAARNKALLDSLTYDTEFYLDPKVQKVLEGLKDPSENSILIRRVAPGFIMGPSGYATFYVENHRGRPAVRNHCVNKSTPCVISNVIAIPTGKKTKIKLSVSSTTKKNKPGLKPHDWELVVLVNGESLLKTAIAGMRDLEVDLTRFAGKTVLLELQNRANNWDNEHGFWHKVEVVSE